MLKTPVKKRLDFWPTLPIVILHYGQSTSAVENIVAALEHTNRVSGSQLETVTVSEAMQVPSFPAPTGSRFGSHGEKDNRHYRFFLVSAPGPAHLWSPVLIRISYDRPRDKVKSEQMPMRN
jgi:hypothetical protein